MISYLQNLFLNVLVDKYALGSLVKVWQALQGLRTQLLLVAASLVLLAGFLQFIPMEKAWEGALFLAGMAKSTLLEKLSRHKDLLDGLSNKIKEKSDAAPRPVDAISSLDADVNAAVKAINDAGQKP